MKKATLSRILGLALALVLALSTSVAFALPSGTSAIEGLPEMPTVPTMVTSAKGYDVTITLSEKLNWLNVVQNWQWLPINFSDDGLTGTYSSKDFGTQPGYGSWNNNNVGYWDSWQEAWIEEAGPRIVDEYEPDWPAEYADTENHVWEYNYVSDESRKVGGEVYREYGYGPGYYIQVPYEIKRFEWVDIDGKVHPYYDYKYNEDYILCDEEDEELEAELWMKVLAAQVALVERYVKLGDEPAAEYCANIGYVEYCPDGVVRTYDREWKQTFGNYRLKTGGAKGEAIADWAYDGEAADGSHVKYGRFGECLQISTTLTGVNFLGTDKTPVKTTVSWCPLEHYGKRVWNWYIYEIVEEYEDGTKLEAHFSSSKGGKLLGTKTIAAE